MYRWAAPVDGRLCGAAPRARLTPVLALLRPLAHAASLQEEKPAAEAAAPATQHNVEDLEKGAEDMEKAARKAVEAWLAALPPTEMALDSWKRLYSNCPASNFRATCIPRLWGGGPVPNSPSDEKFVGFDAAGYSFWFCDYKYDDENTVNFIVMNKVGGWLQRLDYPNVSARKYAFGVVAICKNKEGIFPIRGVWMFRGQEVPPAFLKECVDTELYNWTKVDLSDAAQKKRVEDIICEEESLDGMEVIQSKVFK